MGNDNSDGKLCVWSEEVEEPVYCNDGVYRQFEYFLFLLYACFPQCFSVVHL